MDILEGSLTDSDINKLILELNKKLDTLAECTIYSSSTISGNSNDDLILKSDVLSIVKDLLMQTSSGFMLEEKIKLLFKITDIDNIILTTSYETYSDEMYYGPHTIMCEFKFKDQIFIVDPDGTYYKDYVETDPVQNDDDIIDRIFDGFYDYFYTEKGEHEIFNEFFMVLINEIRDVFLKVLKQQNLIERHNLCQRFSHTDFID